jgi:hypothetical protein
MFPSVSENSDGTLTATQAAFSDSACQTPTGSQSMTVPGSTCLDATPGNDVNSQIFSYSSDMVWADLGPGFLQTYVTSPFTYLSCVTILIADLTLISGCIRLLLDARRGLKMKQTARLILTLPLPLHILACEITTLILQMASMPR